MKRFSKYVYYKVASLFSCVFFCVFEYVTFDNLLERYLAGYHYSPSIIAINSILLQ